MVDERPPRVSPNALDGLVDMTETDAVTPIDDEPLDSVVEIELAIESKRVTFPMVMKALYLQWSAPSSHLRERYRALYRPALSQFMTTHGGISESFYADEFAAGALLSSNDELFSNIWWDQFKFDTTPARALEADINDLRLRADLYLSESHRRICMQRLLRLYKGLISSLRVEYLYHQSGKAGEGRTAPHRQHVADLEQLRGELDGVRETYRRAGLARGQALYVTGAALGTVGIVALAGVAVAVLGRSESTVWASALAGGATGALLSVLERLTRGALRVRFEAERLIVSGFSRPIVGALSGVALFVLVEGNIVPLQVGEGAKNQFFAGIAFLAGFSERLAKDVFGNAAGSLPSGQQQPQAAADDVAKRSTEEVGKTGAD